MLYYQTVQTPSHYEWLIADSFTVWGFCHINVIYIDNQQLHVERNSLAQHALHSWMVNAFETGRRT